MRTYQSDRCKTEIPASAVCRVVVTGMIQAKRYHDLCDGCSRDLWEWVNTPPAEAREDTGER